MDDIELEKTFQQGVAAIRAGDKATARDLLTKVVEQNQLHEQAWLWLSAAVTDKEEQLVCLENVLTINPANETAQRGIRKLKGLPEPVPEPAAAPPPPAPSPQKSKDPDDTWRERLKDTEYTSEATIVKPMHEGPKMGITDLANAWLLAAIFQIPGPYQEEVDYGPAGHIAISVVIAIVLSMLGLGAFAALGFSYSDFRGDLRRAFATPGARGQTLDIDKVLPGTMALGTVLIVLFIAILLITMVGLFFQAGVTNRVAEWLGGKGSVFGLLQALGISMVPTSLIWLLALIAVIVFGPSLEVVIFGAVSLYQFVQTANAVNASHRLGILASMGVVIMSNIAMSGIGCCLIYILLTIIGASAR